MTNQPLVSFIIPVYNLDPDMVRECLESILALSLSKQEREIIVIDDGSEFTPLNNMPDICDDIIYIRQRNQGLSAARNIGLRMATGRFVQFVDGDDRLIRAPYEHCLDIARYHNPDLVFFKATQDDKDVETPFTYNGPTTGSEYMRNNNIRAAAWGYIFERNILGDLRFTPGLLHEDEEFTPQLFLRSERFYSTDSEAYFYRQRDNSIINNQDADHTEKLFADTERILLHLQSLVVPEQDRAALNRRTAQLTMDYLYNIIKRTHDRQLLAETMERLRGYGLYPLPDRDYTKKYKYFRRMIANSLTRNVLFMLIRK